MSLDHALRCEKTLDFFSQLDDIAVLPEPFWTLRAKAKTLQLKTHTRLAVALDIGLFVAFLSTDSARVAARLSAYSAFCLGRSGSFLSFG